MIRLEKLKNSKSYVWECRLTSAGIEIRHGDKDKKLRTVSIPTETCENGVDRRLDELVAQQVCDGYVLVAGGSPETVRAFQRAQSERATQSLKKALDNIELSSYSSW